MPRKPSCILLLKSEESPITCNNFHLSISTQEQTDQTPSKEHNQAVTRAICLLNTLHLRIILKLQKQSCLCSLSANSHFPRAFSPKSIHTHSLACMQANHDLKPDL